MAENKHTMSDLYQMQSLPLSAKVSMTRQRIKAWYEHYDGMVYVSFSGGKDSTVLLDLVRNVCGYEDVPAVFVDTGLEYPEIREFVKTFDNVVWLKPKKNFKQVIEEYGYPFISKEVSEKVMYARRYMKRLLAEKDKNETIDKIPNAYSIMDMLGIERRGGANKDIRTALEQKDIPYEYIESLFAMDSPAPAKGKMLFGQYRHKEKGVPTNEVSKMFNYSKYKFLVTAPYDFSNSCCNVMKKAPIHKYAKESGRKPITGQQASESKLRTSVWLKNGCNGFDMKSPISNPMSFWTEQDVLLYIKQNNLPIASVYGEIVEDVSGTDEVEGQMTISDLEGFENMELFDADRPLLKTTGCSRTGCIYCGYGAHLEKGEGRFERLKKTHPKQYDYIMRPKEEGGLNYKEVIDWLNEHGNLNIKY